jgi:integrase
LAQNGSLVKDHGAWFLRYYEGKKRKKIWLGRVEDYPTKRHIRGKLEDERAKLRMASDTVTTLTSYIERQFLPDVEARLRPSTVAGYRGLLDRYIRERGEIRLWLIRPHHVQGLLNSVCEEAKRPLRKTTYSHLKAFLSVVFNHARNYGFYQATNPVTGVFLPARALASRPTSEYTLDEIQRVLPELENAHRAAVAIAGYTGLRLAEIQGLTWDCYDGETLTVAETQWRGHRSPPKSSASAAFVPVIAPLRDILDEYEKIAPVNGIMFSESLDHVGRRQVKWALKRVGLRWKGWHAFRRGVGSNLLELGVPDKVIQRILRHSRVTITRDRYIKVRDPQVDAAMATFEQAVGKRPAITGREESGKNTVTRTI